MLASGSYKIRFSSQFDRDSVKLIEVPQAIADDLLSGKETLTIRGNADDNVVVVNGDQT
jgi:hypothetical protein